MNTPRVCAAAIGALFLPALLAAAISQRIPVVTQVQGVVFYKTFLTVGVASGSPAVTPTLALTYRSPVDGSVQTPVLTLGETITGGTSRNFEDVIQSFKDAGSIRSQDVGAELFGTLTVSAGSLTVPSALSVVARTFSPATGGGTNGIAYVGRETGSSGSSQKLIAFVRNGTFGSDGTTRANIGLVNEGSAPTDVRITYIDAASGAQIKQFNLSSAAGHTLSPGEVYQLNNIFGSAGVPASTRLISVEATPLSPVVISGYAVQLDSVTNDGSFFLMTEVPSD